MAQRRNQTNKDKFSCSICLDLLKDPVTIPCGHNYCMNCIKDAWDKDQRTIHSCPQCRKTFTTRPELVKNILLAELVEDMKKTGLQVPPTDLCSAGPEDVACDVCTGRKMKALKSCLVCLASYCEQHLQPHYQSPTFKKHKLVEASVRLQENICPRHDEVRKVFCRTDQQCICLLCFMDEHKDHDTVSAAAERKEKQRELELSRQNIQQRIQDREKDVKLLQQEVKDIDHSADKEVEDIHKIFIEMISLIEKRRSDVKQQIRSQQRTEVSRVRELQEKMELEIIELKRKDAELDRLSHTDDNTQFLHNYPSLSLLSEPTDSPRTKTSRQWSFKNVTAAVAATRDQIQVVLSEKQQQPEPKTRDQMTDLSEKRKQTKPEIKARPRGLMRVVLSEKLQQPEPKTRDEFLQYSHQIKLDQNTAQDWLLLSKEKQKITFKSEEKPYFPHPDRFIDVQQVLSRDGLTGRCYWEVEMRGSVEVAVAYKSISRSGDFNLSRFGSNEKSWALCYESGSTCSTFNHKNIPVDIHHPPSSRVGVYLDHSAGSLSFYSVSDTMTLLHRIQTTFTEPLYPGLCLYSSPNFRGTAEIL